MSFTITATNPMGAVSFSRHTAGEALNKMAELQHAGYQHVVVKDNLGRTMKQDELLLLSIPIGKV